MGMFDTMAVDGHPQLCCAAGHAVTSFQTKDFDEPSMQHYVLRGNLLFVQGRMRPERWIDERGQLVQLRETEFEPATLNVCATVYTNCDECDPVCFESERAHWHGGVEDRAPRVEYELLFERGKLIDLKPVRVETRDDIRRELEKNGVHVLPDSDRVVRRHLELLRRRRDRGSYDE